MATTTFNPITAILPLSVQPATFSVTPVGSVGASVGEVLAYQGFVRERDVLTGEDYPSTFREAVREIERKKRERAQNEVLLLL